MNIIEIPWKKWLDRHWVLLLTIGCIVNALGLLSPILEPDGALYATIAKNMALNGDPINLMLHGADWLDKPHFQFWITAISFKIVGFTTLGYKLPALLFWALGLLYTFRLAELFYSRQVAKLATLIYVSAFHLVLSNNDVRAEPYLTGLIVAAIYHFFVGIEREKYKDVVIGALFAAAAMMTKGIFTGIVIFSGLIIHWVWQRELTKRKIFYLTCSFACTLLFILPELISLYLQFDMHPEKVVFGKSNVSGIRFFFWDSQFGRFFNSGPIRGEGDLTFFLHTTLWAFFPWSLLFFASLYSRLRNIFTDSQEKITLLTLLITFLFFSLSKFQLPHYLNIIFPLMSIQTASFLYSLNIRFHKTWSDILIFLGLLSFAAVIFLAQYSAPENATLISIVAICLATVFFFIKKRNLQTWTGFAYVSSMILWLFLNLQIILPLLHYQAGSTAANYLKNTFSIVPETVMLEQEQSYSFDFYYPAEVKHLTLEQLAKKKVKPLLFCGEDFIPELQKAGLTFETLQTFAHYHISEPTENLMNASLRDTSAYHYLIVKFH